jgi:hypothetical protein
VNYTQHAGRTDRTPSPTVNKRGYAKERKNPPSFRIFSLRASSHPFGKRVAGQPPDAARHFCRLSIFRP